MLWAERYVQFTLSPFKLPTNIYYILYRVLEKLANFLESENRHKVHKTVWENNLGNISSAVSAL